MAIRVVLVSLFLISGALCIVGLSACDQLNRPMPVTTYGTSASSAGAPATAIDAGGDLDAGLLPLPGDQPRTHPILTPQPGDTQL